MRKIYYYTDELIYKKVPKRYILVVFLFIGVFGYHIGKFVHNRVPKIEREELLVMLNESENKEFSSKRLYEYLKDINVKFPEIVFAQAVLETGGFQSDVFRSNNNIFGMKEAKRRPTLSKGTELNHAYYDSWKESVIDYALYQSLFLSDLKTPEQYYEYLSKNYAEDPNYVKSVKDIVNNLGRHIK